MSSIPLQFPQGEVAQRPTPGYTLFDAQSVALATFLGTPIAGAVLMLVNDQRLGRTSRGVMVLLCGTALTLLGLLIGWNMPRAGSTVFAILLMMGMAQTARWMQGPAIAEHVQRGGRMASKWAAFGIGMAFFVLLFAVVFVVIYAGEIAANNAPKVLIGAKDEVYYTGSATQTDAQTLGAALKADGYFTDRGVTVALDKGANGTILSFVVKEGSWEDPDTLATFERIGWAIAPKVGGLPVKVRLLNKDRDVKKESSVGSVEVAGKDHVYYMGTATEADAQALGKSLQTQGFLGGKGVDVFLSKHSDGTTLAFVVGEGVWDDAAMVASFEKIARGAALAVGGLPVKLRLENTQLETKKDEVLN